MMLVMLMMLRMMLILSTCKWSMKTKGQLRNLVNSERHTVAPVSKKYHSHHLLLHYAMIMTLFKYGVAEE